MADVQDWLTRVPGLDDGRRHPGMPPDAAAKLFDEILASGKEGVVGLIDTLNEIDDGKDHKTRFVLHAMATHTGAPDRKKDRKKLEAIYAGELSAERPDAVKRFLVMQLQYFAGPDSAKAIAALLKSEDRMLIPAAAAALTAIGGPAGNALRGMRGEVGKDAQAAIDHALKQLSKKA